MVPGRDRENAHRAPEEARSIMCLTVGNGGIARAGIVLFGLGLSIMIIEGSVIARLDPA
jgi:hypothetical protein